MSCLSWTAQTGSTKKLNSPYEESQMIYFWCGMYLFDATYM